MNNRMTPLPHKPSLAERLRGLKAKISPALDFAARHLAERNPEQDAAALSRLVAGSSRAEDPRFQALASQGVSMGGTPKPLSALKGLADEMIDLYRGGAGGSYFTTLPERAASYGDVTRVRVPKSVFEAGQAEAARLGQPTKWDTVLPDEWVRQAKADPTIKPQIHEAVEETPEAVDSLFASLGIKRF